MPTEVEKSSKKSSKKSAEASAATDAKASKATKPASKNASKESKETKTTAAAAEVVVAPALPANAEIDASFARLLSESSGKGIGSFVAIEKQSDGRYSLSLTSEGTALHKKYSSAYSIAEEKGGDDKEVLTLMKELSEAWPSYPGVVENDINEAIEQHETARAAEVAKKAAGEWAATIKSAGVKSYRDLQLKSDAGHLFIQLLANYEFALERNNQLQEALEVGLLARELDPSDPENVLSAIINLYIRTSQPMAALRALEPLQDSLAPFVLYGRALAYYALGQIENATGAVHNALRHWPQVAQSLTREWKGGTPMPKPGEAVSELQVLYGYYEVFGTTWKSVSGAIEWLRTEDRTMQRAGLKPERYVGLTRSGLRTDSYGNVVTEATEQQSEEARAAEQADMLRKAQLIDQDEFVRFLEVRPNEFVYQLTERGEEMEERHNELYRKDMKLGARIEAIHDMLKEWPGHANAAIALVRYYGQRERFSEAIDLLEPVIFDLQKFWSDDFVGTSKISAEWPGNKPLLSAYAYIVLDCAEAGELESAKAFAADYLTINPADQMGVRQKAIELYIDEGDYAKALTLINEAVDPVSAYNVFGRALIGFAAKTHDAEVALKNAVESRPLVWREMNADKHRMPHNYNPSFVHYFSPEEAYNYQQTWSALWMRKYGALAWLRKEGRKYIK